MNKLPVYMTVSAAFEYLFGEIDTIFRLTCVPLLLGTIGTVALVIVGSSLVAALPLASQPAASLVAGLVGLLIVTTAIAVASVAVMRAILFNDRARGRLVVCAFGRTELLVLVASVALFAFQIVIGLIIEHSGVAELAAPVLFGIVPKTIAELLPAIAASAVASSVSIYVTIRLSMLYPAIVAADRFALRESWALTRKRFWRLFAIVLVGSLFGSIVVLIVVGALMMAVSMVIPPETPIPADAAVIVLATQAVVFLVALVFFTTIQASLAAHAYKALKGYALDEFLPVGPAIAEAPIIRPATP